MPDEYEASILFVCMGNICRSPTGEGVFRHYVAGQGYARRVFIDSAGTIGYHSGNPADPRMQTAVARRGYRLESIARQVSRDDIDTFDLVVAMDEDNLTDLEYLAGGSRPHLRMLGSFLPDARDARLGRPVPDPYYGGDAGFEAVIDMIEAACPAMFEQVLDIINNRRP